MQRNLKKRNLKNRGPAPFTKNAEPAPCQYVS